MKHDVLRSVAHNIADSLASGVGLMVGEYEMDIFGEVERSPERQITVDFLTGATHGAQPSESLARTIEKYRVALPGLCEKHGFSVSCFRVLSARFYDSPGRLVAGGVGRVSVEIQDQNGRSSTDEYLSSPLHRPRAVDHLGRLRTQRGSSREAF